MLIDSHFSLFLLQILGNPEDAKFAKGKEVKINTQHPLLTRVQRLVLTCSSHYLSYFECDVIMNGELQSPIL